MLQRNLHFAFPLISIILFALPSLVHNDTLEIRTHTDTYTNGFGQQQREAQLDSSLSPSKTSYDTKNFVEDDTVPAAFDWGANGVSIYTNIMYM